MVRVLFLCNLPTSDGTLPRRRYQTKGLRCMLRSPRKNEGFGDQRSHLPHVSPSQISNKSRTDECSPPKQERPTWSAFRTPSTRHAPESPDSRPQRRLDRSPRPFPKRWMPGPREAGGPSGAGVSIPWNPPGESRNHFPLRSGNRAITTTAVDLGSGSQKLAPYAAPSSSLTGPFSSGKRKTEKTSPEEREPHHSRRY